MKAGIIIGFIFLPILGMGQQRLHYSNPAKRFEVFLNQYLATDSIKVSTKAFYSFIGKLKPKNASFNNDIDFLQHLFFKTHNQFLKTYRENASFGEIFRNGTYNCLTGTALYAILLDHFGYQFKVVETNYHIFILINTNSNQILFETTDPENGFVNNAEEIDNRISLYKQNQLRESDETKTYYKFRFALYNEIGLKELTGLLYYNESVNAYNQKNLARTVALLDHALTMYASPRTEEFSIIIIWTLKESDMEPSDKQIYVQKIQALLNRRI